MELPTWLYSKDGEAREVKTPDEALKLLKDGWEDTPAAFEEGYVRPAPPEKGKAAPNGGDGYKPAPFPSWRYHEDGSSREVKSADELRTLGPGWHDSPDPETWKTPEERAAARDTAPAAVAEAAGAAAGHSLSEQLVAEKARADALERDLAELRKASASPAQPPVVEEAPQPSAEDLEKAGQYEAHVSTLKRVIAGLR